MSSTFYRPARFFDMHGFDHLTFVALSPAGGGRDQRFSFGEFLRTGAKTALAMAIWLGWIRVFPVKP
jgi:hypothetical protein